MTTPVERAEDVLAEAGVEHAQLRHHYAQALANAGLLPDHEEWAETLENDGTYEYTTVGDCRGTWEKRLRRTPRRATGPSEWEEVPDGE